MAPSGYCDTQLSITLKIYEKIKYFSKEIINFYFIVNFYRKIELRKSITHELFIK